jgi:hypothetical protein
MAVLGVFASSAVGVATRPFLRQLKGTPTGPGGAEVVFKKVGGVAADTSDDLWVGEVSLAQLDEFGPTGGFLGPEPGPSPLQLKGGVSSGQPGSGPTGVESLSMDDLTGLFYVTGASSQGGYSPHVEVFGRNGELIKQWGLFGPPAHVAVDNACSLHMPPLNEFTMPSCKEFDASNGAVYVAHGSTDPAPPYGDGLSEGVERFTVNAAGEPQPAPFEFSAAYIEGNQIVGTPQERFKSGNPTPAGVATDQSGDIYVVGANGYPAVYEYDRTGRFIRAFEGRNTPGIGESTEEGGWGGVPSGVAVDRLSMHLLVSVHHEKVEHGITMGEGAIDEFDVATGAYLGHITQTAPGSLIHHPREMAVDSNGQLYAVDDTGPREESEPAHVVDVFGPPGVTKPGLTIAEASERTRSSATVSGSVNPEGLALATCGFQYVTEEAYVREGFAAPSAAECEPPAHAIVPDKTFHAVQARLTGLTAGVTYRYRLAASAVSGGEADSESLAFTTPAIPRIVSATVSNISSEFVDLQAVIDPTGADTTYHFEYDTSPYTSDEPHGVDVPAHDVDIGSGGPGGNADVRVTQQIGPLQSETTYHFRVVASNAVGVSRGVGEEGEATFSTLPGVASSALPDNRGYELVTPPNKGSAEDMFASTETWPGAFFNNDRGYPSDSGESFLLQTMAAFGPFPASVSNVYVFRRTAGAWQTTSLASPSEGAQNLSTSTFDPTTLSQIAFEDVAKSSTGGGGQRQESLVGPPGGPYTTVSENEDTKIAGASHDMSRVVVESLNHTLAPGAENDAAGSTVLYEWAGGAGCAPATSSCTLVDGGDVGQCGAVLGQGQRGRLGGGTHNAVSADGSRLFFTAPDPVAQNDGTGCWNPNTDQNAPQLYARAGDETIEASAPEAGVTEGGGPPLRYPAVYVGAAEDGSKVFFVTETWVTRDHPTGHDLELYEWNVQTKTATRISAGEAGSPAMSEGASVGFIPAVSANGRAVYFTASGRLASNVPSSPGGIVPIYLYRYDTVVHEIRYVATVSRIDYPGGLVSVSLGQIALEPQANWYTTPNGDYLLFGSVHSVTGYDNTATSSGRCLLIDQVNADDLRLCAEVYRYHYEPETPAGGSIVCMSCNANGEPPISNAFFGHSAGADMPAGGPVRAMSDDGSYAFFDSASPLVPSASNGTLDVFEWEAPGTGGCELQQGCVHLVSSGEDPAPSYFLGASSDGHDVFFGTHARLVPQDTDTAGDIYDARICEPEHGNPCIQPPSGRTGQCEGAACENTAASPIEVSPASLTFAGPSNVAREVRPAPEQRRKVKPKHKKRRKGKRGRGKRVRARRAGLSSSRPGSVRSEKA